MEAQEPIRVVIAEDEELILHNLVKKINTMDPIFQIVATAQDGKSALDLVEQYNCDLIITDVQMPIWNGLELIKQVHLRFPHMKKVIISGFNDFEYAREALRHEVTEYLLKPVKTHELEQVLARIKLLVGNERGLLKMNDLGISDHYDSSPEKIVEMVQLYFKKNFHQELNLEAISKQYNFNSSYLTKLFIKHTGEPPSKYLISLRINEAKYLLANDKALPVKEVGERVGYPDQYYFSRIFRQVTGFTPREFRQHALGLQHS
ncbi:response regulator [Cohnella sp.]|uniref:response regulator transcription factor n=1 Tax=Cohnella sp. TaxID=1883426 RepID=UPI00356AE4DD